MPGGVMTLDALQSSFQNALLAGDGGMLSQPADGPREPKEVLLGLYKDAYILRLIEFAQNDHGLLRAYLGDGAFEEMVRAYAAAHPSRYRNAKDFCTHLPDFLAVSEPYRCYPVIAELAALEKAQNDAFYAKDEAAIGLPHLADFAAEDWPGLRFTPQVSAKRLDFVTNGADIWSALKRESDPPQVEEHGPHRILVWRQDVPKFRELQTEEAMLWDEAANGARFGVLCEMAAAYDDPDAAAARVAAYLQGWIASDLLAAAALD